MVTIISRAVEANIAPSRTQNLIRHFDSGDGDCLQLRKGGGPVDEVKRAAAIPNQFLAIAKIPS